LSFFCYYAKEIGCNNLTLSVWNDNEGALRFYQRQGMKPQETTMEMIID
ncbi:TPA: GNAT family N-acetyltransferase, partial [Streptococcus pneumoniae]